jgi:hypothetical protein
MARLRAEIKRGFLRSLWRAASQAQIPLAECLSAFQDRGFQWIRDGRIIVNTAGGGYSTGFNVNEMWKELTPEEVFALSEEFFARLEEAQTTLTNSGLDATDDNLLFQAIMVSDWMQTVRSFQGDYTVMRWPSTGNQSM